MLVTQAELRDALAIERDGDQLVGQVHDGWDVFSITHGGYLAAMAASAALTAADAPDLFTLTVHYLRKVTAGPVRFSATEVGGSRRFTTWSLRAEQDGRPVMAVLASVGDRDDLSGPDWSDEQAWSPAAGALTGRAGAADEPFPTPNIARRVGLRLDSSSAGFTTGDVGASAALRAVTSIDDPDQLTALIACDATPPAVWNALGMQGWVPTVELTAHVRARPSSGPLSVVVDTHHVTDGFLEEDAIVRDATGALVLQSRQLARWTAT